MNRHRYEFSFAFAAIVAVIALSMISVPLHAASLERATFAGGCFWCEESAFEDVPGVVKAISGYTGGTKTNPTYQEVSGGWTGHRESVEVTFDPAKISYQKLLDIFWHNVDPTDNAGQFCDKGSEYRSAIFVHDAEQKRLAEASLAGVRKRFHNVYTDILQAGAFWPAEDYHQQYAKKNPIRYRFYRTGCGRDRRLQELWGSEAGHE